MPPKIGYLLPTREQIMEGRPDAAPLLALAARAEALGYDSVWVGDSLLARPRHDPLTLLAGVAGRVPRVALGTAVLLPALRNPVLLAHQVATLDQISEGRFILGVGIARDVPNIRAEFAACGVPFEKRVGRMIEGLRLCRALWTGEPVDWDGRWPVQRRRAGADAAPPGRAADLDRRQRAGEPGARRASASTAGSPMRPTPTVRRAMARNAGDRPRGRPRSVRLSAAMYLTLTIDDDAGRAAARMDAFLEGYYGAPAAVLRQPAGGLFRHRGRASRRGSMATRGPAPPTSCCASPASTSCIWRRWPSARLTRLVIRTLALGPALLWPFRQRALTHQPRWPQSWSCGPPMLRRRRGSICPLRCRRCMFPP